MFLPMVAGEIGITAELARRQPRAAQMAVATAISDAVPEEENVLFVGAPESYLLTGKFPPAGTGYGFTVTEDAIMHDIQVAKVVVFLSQAGEGPKRALLQKLQASLSSQHWSATRIDRHGKHCATVLRRVNKTRAETRIRTKAL
ncbi:MAG: hypothetical protein ONB06_09545 [candidate division KSB1 bacterium]|nr:hypothetical protein [candidate division KSB1 bacterium]